MVDKDDTQPRSPFKDAPPTARQAPVMNMPEDEGDGTGGPGCFLWGFIGLIIFGLGVAIVLMAGAAGWTSGVRVAQMDATATENRRIIVQFEQIPTDIAAGNQQVLAFRLDYLMGLTPAVSGIEDIQRSATQLAINLQPTVTFTPSPTPTPTETPPEVTAEATQDTSSTVTDTESSVDSRYDLEALLLEAQEQVDLGQYEEAVDTLDVIIAVDPNYRTEIIRGLMSRALRTQAANLYRSLEGVAEAIILTNRAEEFGPIGELDYERLIGGLYLDAQRTIELGNYLSAIRSLERITTYQSTYQGINITEQIFNQYVSYGDALVAGAQYCQAVAQFNSALNYFNSNAVIGKRDAAQNTCQQGISLTLTPGATIEGGQGVAPVGQPGG
ncbi:MAG: hypothetical protein RLP44_04180 [Aggregatilineales bacterium]